MSLARHAAMPKLGDSTSVPQRGSTLHSPRQGIGHCTTTVACTLGQATPLLNKQAKASTTCPGTNEGSPGGSLSQQHPAACTLPSMHTTIAQTVLRRRKQKVKEPFTSQEECHAVRLLVGVECQHQVDRQLDCLDRSGLGPQQEATPCPTGLRGSTYPWCSTTRTRASRSRSSPRTNSTNTW